MSRLDHYRDSMTMPAEASTIPTIGRVRNVDEAIARFGADRVTTYIDSLRRGDPLADAFADDCIAIGKTKAMAMLTNWLDGVPIDQIEGAPKSLKDLVAQLEDTPDFVDFDQIDQGAAAFSRHAREAGLALSTTSLVSGYGNPSASKPLIMTGRFSEMAPVRAIETSMWVFTVARPRGLHRASEGFKRTVRVRMIHAFVRRHILADDEWDIDADGIPINQSDLAYTVVEFMWLPVRSMQMLGVYYIPDDLAAIYAMWRYMAHLMGVDACLVPSNAEQAQQLEDLHMTLGHPPNDDCRLLTHALLTDVLAVDVKQASGIIGIVGRRYGREFVHGLTRAFVGNRIADELTIDSTPWRWVPTLISPGVNIASRIRYCIPGANERQMTRNLAEIDALIAANAEAHGIKHDLVDQALMSL